MMLALRFHDSEVRTVQATGNRLSVQFSAASVRQSNGQSGAPATEGHVPNLELLLTRATWSGLLNDGVGRLSAGGLAVDGVPVAPVPLPWARSGKVTLELNFANGTALSVAAGSVEFRFSGEPRFFESHAC
jgi:hypothetical protein